MAKGFDITFNVSSSTRLTDKLVQLSGDAFERVLTKSVNEVAGTVDEVARARMNKGLGLSDAYIGGKMSVKQASPSANPRATILADGKLTVLGHYNPVLVAKAVKNPANSKGNAALGLSPGQKQGGVAVTVRTGTSKVVRKKAQDTFLMPSKRDSEGNPLIFKRISEAGSGKDRLVALLGPSVYQLFKFQVEQTTLSDEIVETLEETITENIDEIIKGT